MTLAPIKQLLEPSIVGGVMDDKSVSLSMIKKGDRNNCLALAEFTTSRVASARGGNHAFISYDEGIYDPYFQAPDLDWSIIKQTDCQCMLLFCERIPLLSVSIFSFTELFLHDGIRFIGISDTIINFIFPHSQNMKK